MSEYDALDYIPVIGDIYRYSKLGYQIGSWISDAEDNYNNGILSEMVDKINYVGTSDDIYEIYQKAIEGAILFQEIDHGNCKKYQAAFALYLAARISHIWGLCECIIYSDDLKELKKAKGHFIDAKKYCSKVREIEKTIFTSKRNLIDQIREMAIDKKAEVKESMAKWKKQYRLLYKRKHPVKWYLGMWLFI